MRRFSHGIHRIHRTFCLGIFSHRLHGLTQIRWVRRFSHGIHRIHRTTCLGIFSHRLHGTHRTTCWGSLPQIARIYTDAANFRGVHLSPLGFAACQSKKCTNRSLVGATEGSFVSSAPTEAWSVQQRLLHPLIQESPE